MKLRLFVILLLVVVGGAAVFLSLGGSLPRSASAGGSEYLTAAATVGDVTAQVAATGTVAPTQTYALGFGAAPLLVADGSTAAAGSGTWTVRTVTVKVGDRVKKGAVLATASTDDLNSQLQIAKSSLTAASLQEKLAKGTLDDASGTDPIRQARIAWYNARNARRQAQTTVADLQRQIRQAKLVAPIDGTVTAVNITPRLVSTGTAVTLASTAYQVTADVVESDVASMQVGQDATVNVGAIDAAIQGTVSAIAPAAASSSGSSSVVSFPVTVTLTGAPAALRPGMTADVTIVSASASDVLTVPSAALRGTSGSYRVQVLGADAVPVDRAVTVGLVTATSAEITDGLSAGDVVVTGTTAARNATTNANGGFGSFGGGAGGGRNPVVVTKP